MKKLFSIKDNLTGIHNAPFMQHSEAEARRTFIALANDKGTVVNKYATNQELWYLGDYNEQTGEIKSEPKFIELAANVVEG